MQWLKHAFAVETPTDDPPTSSQLELVDKLCHEVRRRGLTPAAVAFLEMSRPLNFIGAQTMHFFQPIVSAMTDVASYDDFAKFLERRDSIDIIAERLERTDGESVMRKTPSVQTECAAATLKHRSSETDI